MRFRARRVRIWLAAFLTVLCIALVAVVVAGVNAPQPSRVTVMTRNLYLGADITRPIRAAQGRTGGDALLALGHANHELREIVDRTSFARRSNLLARELATTRPDLVGLQEVALWRHGPMQLDQLGQPNATEVDYDFLQILLTALADLQASYRVVWSQQESDVEAPSFLGDPLTGTASDVTDVRLTVRDVILVRSQSPVTVLSSGGASYRHQLDIDLGGAPFSFVRGYAWADVSVGSTRWRFVSTHLESQSAEVARAQADELLAGPVADNSVPTVIVCDCNSDPEARSARPGESVARSAAYQKITRGGFSDLWLQQTADGPGFTAALSERLDDPTPAGFERRLDLVLARGTRSVRVRAASADTTGNTLSARDPVTGLWPSDHAGVVVGLQIG